VQKPHGEGRRRDRFTHRSYPGIDAARNVLRAEGIAHFGPRALPARPWTQLKKNKIF
jgi:hypothetical protein